MNNRYLLILALAAAAAFTGTVSQAGKPKPSCNLTPPEKTQFEGIMEMTPGEFRCTEESSNYTGFCSADQVTGTAYLSCNHKLKALLASEGYSNLSGPVNCIKTSVRWPGADYVSPDSIRLGSVNLVTMEYKIEVPLNQQTRRKLACELIQNCLINLDPDKYDAKAYKEYTDKLTLRSNALQCD